MKVLRINRREETFYFFLIPSLTWRYKLLCSSAQIILPQLCRYCYHLFHPSLLFFRRQSRLELRKVLAEGKKWLSMRPPQGEGSMQKYYTKIPKHIRQLLWRPAGVDENANGGRKILLSGLAGNPPTAGIWVIHTYRWQIWGWAVDTFWQLL